MCRKALIPCSQRSYSAVSVIPVHSYNFVAISLLLGSSGLSGVLKVCASTFFCPTQVICCPECRTSPRSISQPCRAVIDGSCPGFSRKAKPIPAIFGNPRAGKTLQSMRFPEFLLGSLISTAVRLCVFKHNEALTKS